MPSLDVYPPKTQPVPDKAERPKRSSLISFTSSKSLTPLQLLRATGFLSAGMIRDEAAPMEVIHSSSSSTSGPSCSQTEYSEGSPMSGSPDPASLKDSPRFGNAIGEPLLNDEAAPFDLGTADSMWFQPVDRKPVVDDEPRIRQMPTRKPPPLPIHKDIGFLEASRPVLVLPGTPEGSDFSPVGFEGDLDLGSACSILDELSGRWPLPPRRSLIIVGHEGELWTSPNSESWTPDEEAWFAPRDSICFSSKGFSSKSVKARIRKLDFSDEQLVAIKAHLSSTPRVSSARPSPLPLLTTRSRARSSMSSPSSPIDGEVYGASSLVSSVKMTEARIDADDDGGSQSMMQSVLHLSSIFSPGQLNRVTIVSSSWTTFTAFCQTNDCAVISAVMGDASRSLSVTVQDDDGFGKLYCTMTLEGATFPASSGGLKKVVTKFNVHLPATLAEVGRRCRESPIGEGVQVQEKQGLRSSVGSMPRSRSRRNAMVLHGFPLSG
ncbi:hypothetical protein FRB90_007234 [Tulasnella sp. 427]|nr:hypothetical protein FRB90_007234 [Tulasnella sp. 427]